MCAEERSKDASPRATAWGCVVAVAGFLFPFAIAFVVFPNALAAYIRWRGDYGANQSPEALAILTTIVATPFLLFLASAAGYVLGVLAFSLVARRLDRGADGKNSPGR